MPAVRAVDRAVGELRRGEPVLLMGAARAVLAVSVEATGPDALDRLPVLAGTSPMLALTPRRAQDLGLPAGTVPVLALPAGALTLDVARRLADPSGPQATPPGIRISGDADAQSPEAAAVELAKIARLLPAAVIAPLSTPRSAWAAWARAQDIVAVDAADVRGYRTAAARALRRVADARVPLAGAEEARLVAFRPADGGLEHFAIVIGEPDLSKPVLIRIHSECFTGDLLGSLRCDCGEQLRGAIKTIAEAGGGILLYMAQEGRGIGLVNKLRAYRLQDGGLDTVDANEALGFGADERIYLPAAEMLRQLGVGRVRLLTNNPDKLSQLAHWGVEVAERVPHVFPANGHNEQYLRTKADRSGHLF
ncbi:MAG TPA: GTP cyclohydrolase II [Azospirillaceae bacterium]|nr:GTP cyclohydrolase II [Azospirillaceae bacterium]